MKARKRWIIALMLLTLLSGCHQTEKKTVRIAQQYGLAYAPLQIAEELDLIEKHLPGYDIEWVKMINTAAIREAMLSGDLDVGFMGIPPFLIGLDKGMDWRIFRALARSPVGLTYDTGRISSLEEIGPDQRIALPQPGSIQHILLDMYVENHYPEGLDLENYLTTLSHPDGQMALLSETQIAAHFTSPPYLFEELNEEGIALLIDGEEAFGGEFTFIVGVVKDGRMDSRIVEGIDRAIDEAASLIENEPSRAVEILSPVYELPQAQLQGYLEEEGMDYAKEVMGIEGFNRFMAARGMIAGVIGAEEFYYEKE